MKKTAFIWRESIYKTEENGIFRCNICKHIIADINTGEVDGNVAASGPQDILYCPDCGNPVAKIKEIEDNKDGYKRGHWKGEF